MRNKPQPRVDAVRDLTVFAIDSAAVAAGQQLPGSWLLINLTGHCELPDCHCSDRPYLSVSNGEQGVVVYFSSDDVPTLRTRGTLMTQASTPQSLPTGEPAADHIDAWVNVGLVAREISVQSPITTMNLTMTPDEVESFLASWKLERELAGGEITQPKLLNAPDCQTSQDA